MEEDNVYTSMEEENIYTSIEDEPKTYNSHASARRCLANASESETRTFSKLETTEDKGETSTPIPGRINTWVVVVQMVLLVVAVVFGVFNYMKLESRDQELTKVSFSKCCIVSSLQC